MSLVRSKRAWLFSLVAAGLLSVGVPATAAEPLAEGETAPEIVGKEFLNTPDLDFKKLKGRVIVVELFRTW